MEGSVRQVSDECKGRKLYVALTIFGMYCSGVSEAAQAVAATAAEPGCATDGPSACADDTHVDVASGLVQLTALVQAIYARVSERHDLTPVQARLLCHLLDGPRGMAELARCFGVEKAALTGLMDRAERRGLARRSPVPGDRRALQVTLTDAGHRAAAAFHAEIDTELSRLISSLAPEDREHFRSTMAEIIASCRTSGPDHC
jgi:DNA-binding MarR family transcriptional regulator